MALIDDAARFMRPTIRSGVRDVNTEMNRYSKDDSLCFGVFTAGAEVADWYSKDREEALKTE